VYAYHPGVNVDEAAARISAARPAVVMFFSTTCSLSQRAFPQFVELSRKVGPRVQVLAFTTDENEAEVQAFLNQHHAPFSADLLEPWPPGFFSRAMQGVGLHVGSVWVRPLVAVIGPDGRVLGQWQGIADLGPVERVIEEADL
jgi:thiol-disulfide isomerase/thioredoxin